MTAAWTGALAAVILALLAIVTAVFAIKAFRTQAQEVGLLAQQLKDQQAANTRQARVLELQAKELQESLAERQRERELLQRQQAEGIEILRVSTSREASIEMQLANNSSRPIRDASFAICAPDGAVAAQADLVGGLYYHPPQEGRSEFWAPIPGEEIHDSHLPVIRAKTRVGFSFRNPPPEAAGLVVARFSDDAGLHWQLGEDMHLQRLSARDW